MILEFNKMYKILEAREVTRVTPQSPNVVKASNGQREKETLVELIVGCVCRVLWGWSCHESYIAHGELFNEAAALCHPCSTK